MPDVIGARATAGTQGITQAIRKVDMGKDVLELEPSAAPLVVLLGHLASDDCHNPEVSWVEDKLAVRFDAINNGAGYTNVATSLIVDNGPTFAIDDLVKVPRTGEVMRVTNVVTNTLTVARGVGGGNQALLDNDELLVIGSNSPEGSKSNPARSNNPVKVTNYAEITKLSWESTETLRHSDTFVQPEDWTRQANHTGIEHKKTREYKMLFGKPSEDLTGSTPRRTMGGVTHYIQTNITAAGGALTETAFFNSFSGSFRFGKKVKTLLASRLLVNVLNNFAKGKLELVQSDNDKTYGLEVMRYRHPHGTLNVITHDMLEGTYGGWGIGLDLSNLKRRYLQGRDTHIEDGIQDNDADTMKSQYLVEETLEMGLEKTHFEITGVTG